MRWARICLCGAEDIRFSMKMATERSENAVAFSKLAGQDIRFSMKMMFAVGSWNSAAACLNCYDKSE